MSRKIVFIGGGNMGSAMIGGITKAGIAAAADITVSDPTEAARKRLEETFGVNTTSDNKTAVAAADVLILSIKPQMFGTVIPEIKGSLKEDTLVISIAAGQSIEAIEDAFGREIKLIRVMPNTPALVGEGMAALCLNKKVSEEDASYALSVFESFGQAEIIPESLMDAVVGVSGSSPAYVYMFIEAMADAAVAAGMPRAQAYKFAAQATLGSAKMVLETGKHPGELKDMVCSPAGTTIAAVEELEKNGFRGSVIAGTKACIDKSREMTGK